MGKSPNRWGKSSRNPLVPFLTEQGYVVIDGALATELERRGADLRDPLWSAKLLIEAPELIKQVHYDYLIAGADVLITASYQASLPGFMARGLDRPEAERLIRLSVELAQDARDEFWAIAEHRQGRLRPLVAASVGPYGAYLADGSEYNGDYGLTERELIEFHRPRMEILISAQPDLFAFETIPSLAEAQALLRLLTEFPEQTAWLSFSCCDAHHVCHGEEFAACAALANESDQIVAVGVNCTAPRYIESLVRDARKVTDKPIVVYPNSGEAWDASASEWMSGTAEARLSDLADEWYAEGARLIGGCCRTTPQDILNVREVMLRQETT